MPNSVSAFCAIDEFRGWYKTLFSFEEGDAHIKKLKFIDTNNIYSEGGVVYSMDGIDLLGKVMPLSKRVKRKFILDVVSSLMEKNALWHLNMAISNTSVTRDEIENSSSAYSKDDEYYKKIEKLDEVDSILSKSANILRQPKIPDKIKKRELVDIFTNASSQAIVSVVREASLSNSFNHGVPFLIMKYAREAKITSFAIDRRLYVNKKLIR